MRIFTLLMRRSLISSLFTNRVEVDVEWILSWRFQSPRHWASILGPNVPTTQIPRIFSGNQDAMAQSRLEPKKCSGTTRMSVWRLTANARSSLAAKATLRRTKLQCSPSLSILHHPFFLSPLQDNSPRIGPSSSGEPSSDWTTWSNDNSRALQLATNC